MASQRGPKLRNADSASKTAKGLIRRESITCPELPDEGAKAEFWRLVEVLRGRGTLDRVDLESVAEAARINGLLDRAHRQLTAGVLEPSEIKIITVLTNLRRGLIRELGLTLQPSRSVLHTRAQDEKTKDPIEQLIKLSS